MRDRLVFLAICFSLFLKLVRIEKDCKRSMQNYSQRSGKDLNTRVAKMPGDFLVGEDVGGFWGGIFLKDIS